MSQKKTIHQLVAERYPDGHLGMETVPVSGDAGHGASVIRTFLGTDPAGPFYGVMIAVLRHGDRYFLLTYHVWSPHQRPCDANRLSDLSELVVQRYGELDCAFLGTTGADFGRKAFLQATPDSELKNDEPSLALRSVAKMLKSYSVDNRLCRKFRTEWTKREKQIKRKD